MSSLTDMDEQDLVYRLLKRAEIRRQIPSRKSVQEGKADRISDLLEEAAREINRLRERNATLERQNSDMGWIINPDRMGQ